MFDFHSDFYFQFFSRDQVGWGLVEFSKVLMIIIIMKPSRYLKGYSAKTRIETTNSKTRSKKFWNNIQIIILFESLELHQRFKMRLCYVTERCSVFPSEYCKWPGGPFPCLSQRGFSLFYGNGLLDAALDDVIFVNCSLCTDVPPSLRKNGERRLLSRFFRGRGDVCTQATSIVGWCHVMLCYYLFRGSGFAVLLFLATIVWNVIKSTRDYLKAKKCVPPL